MTDNNNAAPMDAATIAANPERYGFRWVYRDLNKGRDQKTLLRSNVPHFEVPDEMFATFIATFPKVVSAAINGTSTVIRGQNVARPFIRANPRATDQQIAEHMVRSVLLNVITRSGGTRTTYVGADGKTYATLEAAQAATTGHVVAVDVKQLARDFMAEAVDMFGVTYAQAREAALKKWPEAFVEQSPVDDDDDDGDDEEENFDDGNMPERGN